MPVASRNLLPALVILTLAPHALAETPWSDLSQELFGTDFGWLGVRPRQPRATGSGFEPGSRRLQAEAASGIPDIANKTLDIPCFNITLPFVGTVFVLVTPCGPNISIPPDGLDFKTPFGTQHVPGVKAVEEELEAVDNSFSAYTEQVVASLSLLYFLQSVATREKRKKWASYVKDVLSGHLSRSHDEKATEEHKKAREDPKSEFFVCPGNIYRTVIVLNPNVIGYRQWLTYCFQAGLCFYMQLYLPFHILSHTFQQWHFNGAKSPLWFALNSVTFMTAFAALGNVVSMFSAKCMGEVEKTAEAATFLLQYKQPSNDAVEAAVDAMESMAEGMVASVAAVVGGGGAAAGDVEGGGGGGGGTKVAPVGGDTKVAPAEALKEVAKDPAAATSDMTASLLKAGSPEEMAGDLAEELEQMFEVPEWVLNYLEKVMCLVSIVASVGSALLLQLCMFMKVATFQGDIINIAVVTMSLYFVFDLDKKVMESDPKLIPMYTRFIGLLSEKEDFEPIWVKRIASIGVAFMQFLQPFGLAMIVLVSWKAVGGPNHGTIIGADPFQQ